MWPRAPARRRAGAASWRHRRFLVVDFEATGLHPRRDRPLSVGWVPVDEGRVRLAGAGYAPIAPEGPVPISSIAFHGLLPEDLAGAASADAVGALLREALAGRMLVAHGAALEVGMLGRCGVRVRRRDVVDTMGLAAALDRLDGRPVTRDRRLGATALRLGLPVHRAHHAFGDALTTAGLLLAVAAGLEGHGAATVADLLRLSRTR